MIKLGKSNKIPAKIKWYILVYILLLLLIPSLFFLVFSKSLGVSLFFLLAFFVGLPAFLYLSIYYSRLTFIIDNDKISINSGIIIKRSKSIPFNKVQNVENVRGLLLGLFGLSRVNVWTSSPEQIQVYKKETVHRPTSSLYLTVADGDWLKSFILGKHS